MEEPISLEELITYQDLESNDLPIIEDIPVDDPDKKKPEDDDNTDSKPDEDDDNGADPESDDDGDDSDKGEDSTSSDPISDTDDGAEPDDGTSDPDADGSKGDGTDNNVYQNYYNHLTEGGFLVLDDDFEFDGTPEKLEEAFTKSEENKWKYLKDKMLESIPEEGRPLLDYFIAGGRDINRYVETYGNIDFETVDINNVKDQKRVIRELYQRTSPYNDEKIERIIDKLETLDSLQEDAVEAVNDLKELEQTERQKLITQAEADVITREENLRNERLSIQGAIDKSEFINEQRKNQIKAFLFNQVTRGDSTSTEYNRYLSHISSNPDHIAQLGDILHSTYDPDKGFNMERFEKKGKTQANQSFRDTLDSKLDPKSKVSGAGSAPTEDKVNWEELLKQIDGV